MKRYYLDNKLAKLLLFPNYSTISIGWFVLSKEKSLSKRTKIHETIHAVQWTEVTIISAIILTLLSWVISPLWILLAPMVYYVWYVVEWLLRLPHGDAYYEISFEREAHANDEDDTYLYERKLFAWIAYL